MLSNKYSVHIQFYIASEGVKHKNVLMFYNRHNKTCLKQPLKKNTKMFFKTDHRIMQVNSIVECIILSTSI